MKNDNKYGNLTITVLKLVEEEIHNKNKMIEFLFAK